MKVYVCLPEGKAKALTMSYDDGKIQDERLVSIFNRYGIRGTFNLNYGMIDKKVSFHRASKVHGSMNFTPDMKSQPIP